MSRKRKRDDDWLKVHIRVGYVEEPKFPLNYPSLPKVRVSISRSFQSSPPEAVFKIASFIKTKEEAIRSALYIAERSEGLTEAVTLYDEERRDLNPEEAKNKLDEINFEAERKNSRKMIHFIVSFPNKMRLSENNVKLFMARYMEPFGDKGYAYLYGVHKHQSAIHGHVIMTLSNGRDPKLRFRKREIQQMRSHQVEVAKIFGWKMQASMCKDREIDITGRKAKPKRKTLLERQVPEWFKRRKTEAERELPFGITPEPKRYQINETAKQTLDEWAKHFEEAKRAKQLFIEMYAENKRTAFWHAKNNAKVFGETKTPRPPSFPTSKSFKLTAEEIARIRPEKSISIQQGKKRNIER